MTARHWAATTAAAAQTQTTLMQLEGGRQVPGWMTTLTMMMRLLKTLRVRRSDACVGLCASAHACLAASASDECHDILRPCRQ